MAKFGIGKGKPTSANPEVQEAMDQRDELLAEIKGAVAKVDRLVQEYAEAEDWRQRR